MGRAKQILVVLLVAVLMCLSACGQAGDNSKKQTDSNDATDGQLCNTEGNHSWTIAGKWNGRIFRRSWMP